MPLDAPYIFSCEAFRPYHICCQRGASEPLRRPSFLSGTAEYMAVACRDTVRLIFDRCDITCQPDSSEKRLVIYRLGQVALQRGPEHETSMASSPLRPKQACDSAVVAAGCFQAHIRCKIKPFGSSALPSCAQNLLYCICRLRG